MSLKKRDLKMSCRLYLNRTSGSNKQDSSLVILEDSPYTTVDLEVFKRALLLHCGLPVQPIKVSLIMDNGKEYPINSQVDFQVALYTFRRNARAKEEIPLLLETLSDPAENQSNDAETQIDDVLKPQSILSSLGNITDQPPEWFKTAVTQLKNELKKEVADQMKEIMNVVMAEFSKAPPQAMALSIKGGRCKREKVSKKHAADTTADPKDLIKSYKLERKLEVLEHKASKYRERRAALAPRFQKANQKVADSEPKSSDSEAGVSSSKEVKEEEPQLDARPISLQGACPHMMGGEVYLHQWEVKNTGLVTWDFCTQLQYTWGSKKLIPVEKAVSVPHLKPGEQGVISVCLQVPTQVGKYECYWQFVHKGRRFGHWLGVQLVVDGFTAKDSALKTDSDVELRHLVDDSEIDVSKQSGNVEKQQPINNAPVNTVELKLPKYSPFLFEYDSDCSWSSEPTHLWKTEEKSDYVFVPVPQCFKLDAPEGADEKKDNSDSNNNGDEDKNSAADTSSNSIKLRDEELDNIVVITVPKDEQVKEGFIYVHVDGQKVLIPKNILKSEVVTAAQELERSPSAANSIGVIVDGTSNQPSQVTESPTPSVASTVTQTVDCSAPTLPEPLVPQQAVDLTTAARETSEEHYFEASSNYMSHCSATGSCFSETNGPNRIFVFPQDNPGYEVVRPEAAEEQPANPFIEPVANYQQTPPEERVSPELLARTPTAAQEPRPATASAPPEQVHILPESLVSGAVNVASSAINTARSVINMIKPQQASGRWDNGHWVSTNPVSPMEQNLQALADMGFWNRDLNATLLARHNNDLNRVVAELVQ